MKFDVLRELREKKGYTLENVAEKIGVSRASIARWETGVNKKIDTTSVQKLAKLYDVDINWLVGWNSDRNKIEIILNETKLEEADLANILNTTLDQIESWKKEGIGKMPLDKMQLLKEQLKINTKWLLGRDPNIFIDDHFPVCKIEIIDQETGQKCGVDFIPLTYQGNYFYIKCNQNSLRSSSISLGSFVLLKETHEYVNNSIVLIKIKSQFLLKKVIKKDNLTLLTDDLDDIIMISQAVKLLGVAIEVKTKLIT